MFEIKYDVRGTSLQTCIGVSILGLFFAIPPVLGIFFTLTDKDLNFSGILPLLLFLMPMAIAIGLFIYRNKKLKEYKSEMNILKVVFDNSRAKFCFTREDCNFECHCDQIKKIELILNTSMHKSKNSSYPALDDFTVKFNVLNKDFSIDCAPCYKDKFIYKLIDNIKEAGDFTYRIIGPEVEKYPEMIDIYREYGIRPVLTNDEEKNFKAVSIMLFIFSLILAFPIFQDTKTQTPLFIYSHILLLAGISIFFDLVLIYDKIHERLRLRDTLDVISSFNNTNDKDYSVESTKFHTPFVILAVKIAILYFIYCKYILP